MDIRELVRQLRVLESDREVQRFNGLHRKTIRRYRQWAGAQGLLEGELPDVTAFNELVKQTLTKPTPPPQQLSTVEPYRALVEEWFQSGVEVKAIWHRLRERGFSGSVHAVYRFTKHLKAADPPEVFVRVERSAGEEAQLDFGLVGEMIDELTGEIVKSYAFVMVLSFSRYLYVEFVTHQDLPTFILCLQHAFSFFGGVPTKLVCDNLKAAVVRHAWDGSDIEVGRAFREMAEHYGFLIAPTRPYTPQHKGKVENGVHYVQRNFMGGRALTPFSQANREVQEWYEQTAGLRIHGTTKLQPRLQFEQVEKATLRPLPPTPYELSEWKSVKVGRDCYVNFAHSYYSVPYRLVGQTVWLCASLKWLKVYSHDHQLLATHHRAKERGERLTHPDHLPPTKLPGLTQNRDQVLVDATAIGPHTLAVVTELLADEQVDRTPAAAKVVKLASDVTIGPARLEAACGRALEFGEVRYLTIKRILTQNLEQNALPPVPPPPPVAAQVYRYSRSSAEILGRLFVSGVAVLTIVVETVSKVWNWN
jgi:transposase